MIGGESALPVRDHDSREPLYFCIKKDLVSKIEGGAWQIGEPLATEPVLQEQYKASRGTVRRALMELEFEGYIRRRSGQGTFIAATHPRIPRAAGEINSFTQQLSRTGYQVSSKVLFKGIIKASEAQGRAIEGFHITSGTDVVHIKRLRLGDGIPLAIQSVFLLPDRCPGILEEDLSHLMQLYERRYGCKIALADERLQVTFPRPEEVKLLHIKRATPIAVRDRVSYDQGRQPFEVLHSIEVAEKFAYQYRIVEDATASRLDSRGVRQHRKEVRDDIRDA